MNWGTLVQQITEDLHFNAQSSDVKRCLCDAIKALQRYRLPDEQGTFEVPLPIAADSIKPGAGLPSDFREVIGDELYVSIISADGTTSTDEAIVRRIGRDEMEQALLLNAANNTGTPLWWNFYAGKLRFTPRADVEGYTLRGSYVIQLGIPYYEYASSAWAFYTPDGDVMYDAYASPWFKSDRLAPLVVYYTRYLLFTSIIKDADKANMELSVFSQFLTSIRDELEQQEGGLSITPWP